MKVLDYLEQIEKLDVSIKQKFQEKDECIKISSYIDDKALKDKISSLATQINSDIELFVFTKDQIINQIQGLSKTNYQKVLYKKYVELKSFSLIAKEMNYTYQWIIQMHSEALAEFTTTYASLLE